MHNFENIFHLHGTYIFYVYFDTWSGCLKLVLSVWQSKRPNHGGELLKARRSNSMLWPAMAGKHLLPNYWNFCYVIYLIPAGIGSEQSAECCPEVRPLSTWCSGYATTHCSSPGKVDTVIYIGLALRLFFSVVIFCVCSGTPCLRPQNNPRKAVNHKDVREEKVLNWRYIFRLFLNWKIWQN